MYYNVQQLRKLRDIREKGFDDYFDDVHTSDKQSFNFETECLFKWIEKMESLGRINYLLNINE